MLFDIGKLSAGFNIKLNEKTDILIPASFGVNKAADVKINGSLSSTGDYFVFEGQAECKLLASCGSCLAPVELELEFNVLEKFVEEGSKIGDDDIVFSSQTINLLPAIERNLFAEIPMKIVCSANCAGLCSKCGANLNIETCECNGTINEIFSELRQFFID